MLGITQTVQDTEEARMAHDSGALVVIDQEVTLQMNVHGLLGGAVWIKPMSGGWRGGSGGGRDSTEGPGKRFES